MSSDFKNAANGTAASIRRTRLLYAAVVAVFCVFTVRAFYVQVIRYNHYHTQALSDQLKQYAIPAARGSIKAHDGSEIVPFVLNQKLYTLYADPALIKDAPKVAQSIAGVMGGDANSYERLITTKNTRFVVLKKKLDEPSSKKLMAYKYPGLGTQAQAYRTYPQGALAGQLLGFVDEGSVGRYGVEQALNKSLSGTPGELKAVTDINGVPLAANRSNIMRPAVTGDDVVLTLDLGVQKRTEQILAAGIAADHATSGSAVIIDPTTGAIKAMANYPSYDPSNYAGVDDGTLFQNAAVSHPIEVGSIMKPLTMAAALDQGVVKASTTYYDPATFTVDDFKITNIEEDGGPGAKSMNDLLNLSLNTGATWLLMQMGNGQLNRQARDHWYSYMHDKYQFGKETGIEQGYEATGKVPSPENKGNGVNLTYANTAFGQAMTATPVQVAAALSSVINGGTYYAPRLVDQTVAATGKISAVAPKVVQKNVVSATVSSDLIPMMQYTIDHHSFARAFDQTRYIVGGKTGTAQIAKPGGGYYDDQFNGTYMGFVGGEKPQYVIVVFVIKPVVKGYAGSQAAQPIFGDLAHMLLDGGYVNSK